LIAPECEGILIRCLQWLDGFQSKLVCGPQSLIETFADKNETQQVLKPHGIPVPSGVALPQELQDLSDRAAIGEFVSKNPALIWPLVLKPSGGAGGDNVIRCNNLDQLDSAIGVIMGSDKSWRLERYIAGLPVSVSIVRNQHDTRLLPAIEQRFSNSWNPLRPDDLKNTVPETVGHFVGSAYPLPEPLQHRAATLAAAVAASPTTDLMWLSSLTRV